MDTTKNKEYRTISFCAGYGGIERGIESVGNRITPLAVCEIEAYAIANSIAKMEAGQMVPAPMWTDLKTFPLAPFRGKCDLLTGGFPCQPFSSAGARNGDEDPRHLFPYFIRAIDGIRPRYVFLENVAGLLSAKLKGSGWRDPEGTPVLLHVLRELERVGYRTEASIFSARETGAPHLRKRVFILAKLEHPDHGHLGQGEEVFTRGDTFNTTSEETKLPNTEDVFGNGCNTDRGEHQQPEEISEPRDGCGETFFQWPARANEPQHEWEEPRVVGDTDGSGLRTKRIETEQLHETDNHTGDRPGELGDTSIKRLSVGTPGQVGESTKESKPKRPTTYRECETKPELGRTIDGASCGVDAIANRVDRLRMCGNGVVPQTAAIAWRTLMSRLNNTETI